MRECSLYLHILFLRGCKYHKHREVSQEMLIAYIPVAIKRNYLAYHYWHTV